MRIALGADHRGADTILALRDHLKRQGHDVVLFGVCDGTACDYPDRAREVGEAITRGEADRGILACGSGIGISIAANKILGIRAALALDETMAEMSRRHNDANVLCLAGDRTSKEAAAAIADHWLATDFEGGRHQRRVDKITALESDASTPPATVE